MEAVEYIAARKDHIKLIKNMANSCSIIFVTGQKKSDLPSLNKVAIDYAIDKNLPLVDFSTMCPQVVARYAPLLPIPSILPDPPRYSPMSRVPVEVYAELARRTGAFVSGFKQLEIPSKMFCAPTNEDVKDFQSIAKNVFPDSEGNSSSLEKDSVITPSEVRVSNTQKYKMYSAEGVFRMATANRLSPLKLQMCWWLYGTLIYDVIMAQYNDGYKGLSERDLELRVALIKKRIISLDMDNSSGQALQVLKVVSDDLFRENTLIH